jgi:hypothetical protein
MNGDNARHPLCGPAPVIPDPVVEVLWGLFVAIGPHWQLVDEPGPYRLRFLTFLENRIAVDPLYSIVYECAAAEIRALIAAIGEGAAYDLIFGRLCQGPIAPEMLQMIRKRVSGELIAWRIALGGFATFGARNYWGYFGGANIKGLPVPYRTPKDTNDER